MKQCTYDEKRNISLPICVEQHEKLECSDFPIFRLILITSGTGIANLNNKRSMMMTPVVYCLNEKDSFFFEQPQGLMAKIIYFDTVTVNNVLTVENLNDKDHIYSESEYRDYCLLLPFIDRIEKELCKINIDILTSLKLDEFIKNLDNELTTHSNDFWRCRSRAIFLQILFLLQSLGTENQASNKFEIYNDSDIAKKLLLYLHTHYDQKLTLKQLSEEFHINRTTLSEEFEKTTKLPVINYLIKLRVYMASIMIRNTDLPVSEIMYKTGFNDITHFGRMFRKHTGCSPSEYRARAR
jgi:AraC family L-rhamnose operon regulatory protein RhaS